MKSTTSCLISLNNWNVTELFKLFMYLQAHPCVTSNVVKTSIIRIRIQLEKIGQKAAVFFCCYKIEYQPIKRLWNYMTCASARLFSNVSKYICRVFVGYILRKNLHLHCFLLLFGRNLSSYFSVSKINISTATAFLCIKISNWFILKCFVFI